MNKRPLFITLLLAACLTLSGASLAASWPAPIQALKARGITIRSTMPAPAGFKGYVGDFHGRALPVYLLPDGKHTMIGNLFDANGQDLTGAAFAANSTPKLTQSTWDELRKADWIAEGSKSAKRIVYVFTDTECPYCHRLWHAIRPQVKAGKVQVRYLLVAVIKPQSMPRAASVLDAKDPIATFTRNESDFRNSPVPLARQIPAATREKINANNNLMDQLGISGTPGVMYKDAQGKVHKIVGLPPESAIRSVFGS